MKYALIVLIILISVPSLSQECQSNGTVVTSKETIDINKKAPKELEGATITVRTKDGKEHVMSADDYKVVKRVQQFITTKLATKETVTCKGGDHKSHIVSVYGQQSYTDVSVKKSSTHAELESTKEVVPGLQYQYQFKNGIVPMVGMDAQGNPKVGIGLEFQKYRPEILVSGLI